MNQPVLGFLDSKHSKPLPSLLEVSAETNAAFSGMLKSLSEVCTHTQTLMLSCRIRYDDHPSANRWLPCAPYAHLTVGWFGSQTVCDTSFPCH